MSEERQPDQPAQEDESGASGGVANDATIGVKQEEFYSDAADYWEGVPATVDGMLGGFGSISSTDIAGSKNFLLPFIEGPEAVIKPHRALDCGAGIGRVSKRLLLPLFSEVDLVEQNPTFLMKAKTYLRGNVGRVGGFFPCGLQDFTPEEGRYDLIWCQWVLAHLTDDDLVAFLKRSVKGLRPGSGLIVAKENIASLGDVFDEDDSSVTRCVESYRRVFAAAGLTVVREENQPNFPRELFQVTMFALRQ